MQAEDDEAVIRVKDTGIGIEPALLGTVFELFVQTQRTLDRSSGGMGVGLTLVRAIAQLHEGSVEAHSGGVGLGSELTLRLPKLASSGCTAVEESRPATLSGNGKLIVVVEDDADNREMLTALLKLHGYQVQVAGTGQTGIELIERLRPLAALVDIGLPGMSGYEVAEHVRRNLVDDHTYLIALTGYGQPGDVQQALDRGFDRHIVKPLTVQKLMEVLTECPAVHTGERHA